jgi:serine/threonine protein kinase
MPSCTQEVDSLLQAHREARDFLRRAAVDLAAPGDGAAAHGDHIGERIGPYRIVAELGRGGMGEVYRAVRDEGEFDKAVAIELLRAGWQGAEIAGRFRAERSILARLGHPNIARLADGGVADRGSPYFVMELVEGEPITQYCRARDLDVRQRVVMFLKVCAAVQCAHQNLVVHRDIKPGNILVTRDGEPKLLDFGIAQLLERADAQPSGPETIASLRVLTPGYASPEQAWGDPVTTASDVYSLGVVLYELLADVHPFPQRTGALAHASLAQGGAMRRRSRASPRAAPASTSRPTSPPSRSPPGSGTAGGSAGNCAVTWTTCS